MTSRPWRVQWYTRPDVGLPERPMGHAPFASEELARHYFESPEVQANINAFWRAAVEHQTWLPVVAGRYVGIDQVLPPARVGDLIAENAEGIPLNVLEFVDCEGDRWRRQPGRYVEDDELGDYRLAQDGEEGQEYEWVCPGGLSTTDGRLVYAPLRVTAVRESPATPTTDQ